MEWLKNNLVEILPHLGDIRINEVAAFLEEVIGVEQFQDLQIVTEDDLSKKLKPIQARKLVNAWKKSGQETSSDCISSNTSSKEIDTESYSTGTSDLGMDWSIHFKVPWEKFPPELIRKCTLNQPPSPSDRGEMVRIIIEEVMRLTKSPGRKNLEVISAKILARYPKSFRDALDKNTEFNYGHRKLTDQLYYQLENQIRRRKRLGYPVRSPKKRRFLTRNYACINFDDKSASSDDAADIQEWLRTHYNEATHNSNSVESKMMATFSRQREAINNNTSISELKAEWPFLFEEKFLMSHYCKLLDRSDAKQYFVDKLGSAAHFVYRAVKKSSHAGIKKLIEKIKEESRELQAKTPRALYFLDLLIVYFKEDLNVMYRLYKEEDDLSEILQTLPPAPIIFAIGSSICDAEFHVCIERCVAAKCETFFAAVVYAFGAFYVFNMEYPSGGAVTWEFIQRYFAGIELPGSTSPKKRKYAIHPKVMNLINAM